MEYKIALLVHKCLNDGAQQYVIAGYHVTVVIGQSHGVSTVSFWKSSATTQPLVTGHSLLPHRVFGIV